MPSALEKILDAWDELLTPVEAAQYLKLKNPHTLAVWRCTQRYDLAYVKVGHLIRYRIEGLDNFIKKRSVQT